MRSLRKERRPIISSRTYTMRREARGAMLISMISLLRSRKERRSSRCFYLRREYSHYYMIKLSRLGLQLHPILSELTRVAWDVCYQLVVVQAQRQTLEMTICDNSIITVKLTKL